MRSPACEENARSLEYFEFERRVQYHFIEGYTPY